MFSKYYSAYLLSWFLKKALSFCCFETVYFFIFKSQFKFIHGKFPRRILLSEHLDVLAINDDLTAIHDGPVSHFGNPLPSKYNLGLSLPGHLDESGKTWLFGHLVGQNTCRTSRPALKKIWHAYLRLT